MSGESVTPIPTQGELVEALQGDDHSESNFVETLKANFNGDSKKAIAYLESVLRLLRLESQASNGEPDTTSPTAASNQTTSPEERENRERAAFDWLAHDELDDERSILVMLVHRNLVGAIIGKSGQTISHIEENTGSHVQVQKTTLPGMSFSSLDRSITITGTILQNLRAQQLISKVVAAKVEEHNPDKKGHHSLTIVIPQQSVRLIIGKGGQQIKDLEAQSGAHVQIDKETTKGLGRKVIITGAAESRDCAQYLISRMIREDTMLYSKAQGWGDPSRDLNFSSPRSPPQHQQPTGPRPQMMWVAYPANMPQLNGMNIMAQQGRVPYAIPAQMGQMGQMGQMAQMGIPQLSSYQFVHPGMAPNSPPAHQNPHPSQGSPPQHHLSPEHVSSLHQNLLPVDLMQQQDLEPEYDHLG